MVGSCQIAPADKIEVLGVSFDKMLTPNPHLSALVSSTRALTAITRRLSLHLPPDLMKSVVGALYRGKIGYGSLVLRPRLSASDPTPAPMAQLQVAINNLARATLGKRKSERLKLEDLLSEAGFMSLNRLVVYSIAMECWRAVSLRDVPNGPLNPLGSILTTRSNSLSRTRAAANGCLPPPTKYQVESFSWWAYKCWNSSLSLRTATSVSAAKRAAKMLAEASPF